MWHFHGGFAQYCASVAVGVVLMLLFAQLLSYIKRRPWDRGQRRPVPADRPLAGPAEGSVPAPPIAEDRPAA